MGLARRRGRGSRFVVALTLLGLLASRSPAMAIPMPHPAETKAALAVCATEREPLLALQKEYTDIRRAKLTSAFASSAKAGLSMLFAGNPLFTLASNVAKRSMNQQQPTAPMPGDPTGALTEALSLNIPGVGPPAAGQTPSLMTALAGQNAQINSADARTALALSIVAAIGGSTDVYIKIKQTQLLNDPKRIALAVDTDAGTQVSVSTQAAVQLKALADCREHQMADYNAKLEAANEKDRKQLVAHNQTGLKSALTADADLANDLVTQQATVTRVFTQGRAMAEGKSEADVLDAQPAAYSSDSPRGIWKLPPPEGILGAAMQPPPPPPKPSLMTLRPTALRAAPEAKAKVVMSLPAGHILIPSGPAAADVSWWEVDVAGVPTYIAGADLGEPGSALDPVPTKGKGKGKGAVAPQAPPVRTGPPPFPAPANIRALNGQVTAAKASGAERLKVLSANAQATGV
jgi:hypothetical protein